jgi:hypothetical protein
MRPIWLALFLKAAYWKRPGILLRRPVVKGFASKLRLAPKVGGLQLKSSRPPHDHPQYHGYQHRGDEQSA